MLFRFGGRGQVKRGFKRRGFKRLGGPVPTAFDPRSTAAAGRSGSLDDGNYAHATNHTSPIPRTISPVAFQGRRLGADRVRVAAHQSGACPRGVTDALRPEFALHQVYLSDGPIAEFRDEGPLHNLAHFARLFSKGLDATDGQVRPEGTFFGVIAAGLRLVLDLCLKFPQRMQFAPYPDPYHAGIFRMRKTADAFEGELKRSEIGRARVGKECRSRWSPYH